MDMKKYRIELTRKQLYILKEQMSAVADPSHRDREELELLELIERFYRKALMQEGPFRDGVLDDERQ